MNVYRMLLILISLTTIRADADSLAIADLPIMHDVKVIKPNKAETYEKWVWGISQKLDDFKKLLGNSSGMHYEDYINQTQEVQWKLEKLITTRKYELEYLRSKEMNDILYEDQNDPHLNKLYDLHKDLDALQNKVYFELVLKKLSNPIEPIPTPVETGGTETLVDCQTVAASENQACETVDTGNDNNDTVVGTGTGTGNGTDQTTYTIYDSNGSVLLDKVLPLPPPADNLVLSFLNGSPVKIFETNGVSIIIPYGVLEENISSGITKEERQTLFISREHPPETQGGAVVGRFAYFVKCNDGSEEAALPTSSGSSVVKEKGKIFCSGKGVSHWVRKQNSMEGSPAVN